MDEIREFLQRFGQQNDITVRWSRSDDPECTHPEKIEVSWIDEQGQSWSSDVLAHANRPGQEHLMRALAEAAKESLNP